MPERRTAPTESASEFVSLRAHFDRIIRDEAERFELALRHHQEMHGRDHTWADRLQDVFQQSVERTIEAHVAQFDAFVTEYRHRHQELRERSDGRDDRLREDFSRELKVASDTAQREALRLRESHEREVSETKDNLSRINSELSAIKSRGQAQILMVTIFLTIITIALNAGGLLLR